MNSNSDSESSSSVYSVVCCALGSGALQRSLNVLLSSRKQVQRHAKHNVVSTLPASHASIPNNDTSSTACPLLCSCEILHSVQVPSMDSESPHMGELLSLDDHGIPMDEESPLTPTSDRPHLISIFAEFARTRPRSTQSRYSDHGRSIDVSGLGKARSFSTLPKLDLRALDYVSEYDSHLMCPICHVPFIDPTVLDCDHTFCSSCYQEYRITMSSTDRPQCPTCRSLGLGSVRKASRLITNMCNDILVRCPNEGCQQILPRYCIEQHSRRDCPEERRPCPDTTCPNLTKRKDLVADECRHRTHIECECGEMVKLGQGEWLQHKHDGCTLTHIKCENCQEQISRYEEHECRGEREKCPGNDFGCDSNFADQELETHKLNCVFARLAPYFNHQAKLLSDVREQLAVQKIRNEVLETGFERINEIMHDQVLPKLENLDVEEIERMPSPASAARDMLLPAHLRALTPSPSQEQANPAQQHLLALHESLRGNVAALENDISHIANSMADLDARSSMQIMNETLRIKEELAHTNAALFSTRAQVQWLLNRERMGNMRGRTAAAVTTTAPIAPAMDASSSSISAVAGPSSAGNSAVNTPSLRPVRRPSGGSQERVKL